MKKIILSIAILALSFSVIAQDNNEASGDSASLAILMEAVEAHPDSISAHQKFIKAFRHNIPNSTFQNEDSVLSLLESQYTKWMQEIPKSAAVTFALGDAYAGAESSNTLKRPQSCNRIIRIMHFTMTASLTTAILKSI